MASAALQSITNKLNPSSSSSSKPKSKKKAGTKNLEPPAASSEKSSALNSPRNGPVDDAEGSGEPAHVREIAKQIRNINKKLNSMAKVDSIIAENPNVSLDDLVTSRKINADQKAQALKKPQLQAQVASFEAQLNAFREIEESYEKKSSKAKDALLAAHATEIARTKVVAKLDAEEQLKKETRTQLLTFSRFLAAAANRRNMGDDTSEEARAFEGALLLVYGGDSNAVDAAEKIINGSSDRVPAVDGTLSDVPFSRVKELSLQDVGGEEATYDEDIPVTSDPTIVNAGLTELNDPTTAEIRNSTNSSANDNGSAPGATSIGAEASNAAADSQWDPTKPGSQEDQLGESYEIIPRDTAEVDNVPQTTGTTANQSWSDEVAAESSWADSQPGQSDLNGSGSAADGAFQEVTHHRGGRRGGVRGGDRGRGGRGGGRGFRGDGRGRGRGRGDGSGSGNFRGRARGGD